MSELQMLHRQPQPYHRGPVQVSKLQSLYLRIGPWVSPHSHSQSHSKDKCVAECGSNTATGQDIRCLPHPLCNSSREINRDFPWWHSTYLRWILHRRLETQSPTLIMSSDLCTGYGNDTSCIPHVSVQGKIKVRITAVRQQVNSILLSRSYCIIIVGVFFPQKCGELFQFASKEFMKKMPTLHPQRILSSSGFSFI